MRQARLGRSSEEPGPMARRYRTADVVRRGCGISRRATRRSGAQSSSWPYPFRRSSISGHYARRAARAIDFAGVDDGGDDRAVTRADPVAAWQHGPMSRRRGIVIARFTLAGVIAFATFGGLAATSDRAAFAQSGVVGFQTPTKNINCTIYTDLSPRTLECMVSTYTGKVPTRPNDCELDWTPQADLGTTGRASLFACRGDTSWWVDAPVLAYGKTFRNGSFTCKSEKTGVTCTNGSKRGFRVSRGSITSF